MTSPNSFQRAVLIGLNTLGKHVYAGYESPADRATRKRQERRDRGLASGRNESSRDLNRAGRRLVVQADAAQDRALRRAARRPEVTA
ncbi:hypothetical protein GMYAFLOJ_CDS0036 [Microbacterium phage phiMiGM15]